MALATVTTAGINAALIASSNGMDINVTYFKVGEDLIVPNPSMTDVSGLVYTGMTSQISYMVNPADTMVFKITLGPTVGDFDVGNVGLFLDTDVMFSIMGLLSKVPKTANNLPVTIGDVHQYYLIHPVGLASVINVTILQPSSAALPVVPTENDLPPALSAPYPAYIVQNHTAYGFPALAVPVAGTWNYSILSPNPAQGSSGADPYLISTLSNA